MTQLGFVHYIYILMTVIVIVTMMCKKDIVLPCIIGLFLIGFAYTGSFIKAVQSIYNSFMAAGKEFFGIILVISLVVAMSKALGDIGADELMISPIKKIMVNKKISFFILGLVMFIVSLFIWPSPGVALVGALLLPAALETGLPAVWAAAAMNLFGHGMALSGDYFIQGAPSITAKAVGSETFSIIKSSLPLWAVMNIVTCITALIIMSRDIRNNPTTQKVTNASLNSINKAGLGTIFVAFFTPLAFITDIFLMYKFQIKGGDATALIGGTAIIVMSVVAVIQHKFIASFEKVTEYVKDGFIFGIKIFAPVIVIGAFFFLGSEGTAKEILGPNATGLLTDIGNYIANRVPMSKVSVVIMEAVIGGITGLDGSGFSGLPLVGSLAQTFSSAVNIDKNILASVGQITAVWVGGGAAVPWAVIPVAAICNVKPEELVRKNIIPIITGFAAVIITAIIIM